MKDQERIRESLCDALLPMPFAPHTRRSAARRFLSLFTISLFLFSVLWTGVRAATRPPRREALDLVGEQATLGLVGQAAKQPDFARYVNLTSLSKHELRTRGGRVMFVGDIHGMHQSLKKLLKKLKFDPEHDTLIHTGDIIVKGPQSRKVIQELVQIKAFGVRGNQDQKVIEWRGWIEWVLSQEGGKAWLHKMEKRVEATKKLSKSDFKHFQEAAAAKGWEIPDGWKFGDDIYVLARQLRREEYQYLLDLPIALHIPSLHTIVVHAGILPMDPRRKLLSHRQPLAHPPNVKHDKGEPVLRNLQELALFKDIPQNTNPWVKLNMRSISDNGEVTRENDGTPWSKLWHKVIDLCDGFDVKPELASANTTAEFDAQQGWEAWAENEFKHTSALPCRDVTVVYGHAASRGLDLKKWSKGLDTGCVYNLKLTSLVLGKRWKSTDSVNSTQIEEDAETYEVDEELEGDVILFGKKGRGKVVQVRCAGGAGRLH